MRKSIVLGAVVLLAVTGCVRERFDSTEKGKRVYVQVRPDFGETKTLFEYEEGAQNQFIRWEAGDALAVAVTRDESNYLVGYFTDKLTIGNDLEDPIFSGDVHLDWYDERSNYQLYAVYPFEAVGEGVYQIDKVKITLPSEQHPTQKGFDGKADVMVSAPYPIELDGEYDSCMAWPVFAHVFGFGRISFDCTHHENELVRKVIIQATGTKRDIAGEFLLNMSEPVGSADFRVEADSWEATASSRITLIADGTVALKDYQAWFVANPGDYDVNITVVTNLHTLSYDRTGLRIQRKKIIKPTIHSATYDAIDNVKLLRSMKENSGGGTTRYDFVYDASSRLVSILYDGATYADISYPDANTVVWTDAYGDGWTGHLDVDGKIISREYGSATYNYTYQDGHLVTETCSASGWHYRKDYTWQNGDIYNVTTNPIMEMSDANTTYAYSCQEDLGNVFGLIVGGVDHLVILQPAFAHLPSSAVMMIDEIQVDADFGYTFDNNGYPLSATEVLSTRSGVAYTFSWTMDDPAEPVLPDMPDYGEGQPTHVVLTDAEGTTTRFDFTYGTEGRMTKTVVDGATTYTFSYSGSSVTASVSNGDTYSFNGNSLYLNGVSVDISADKDYKFDEADRTGVSSLLLAISEGWDAKALFPVFMASAASDKWPTKCGKDVWTYQVELNGLVIGIRCYQSGIFQYGVSVSYNDEVPAAQKVYKSMAAPEKKLVRKISLQGDSDSWSEYHFYDDTGNLKELFRKDRWSNMALLFERTPERLDMPYFSSYLDGGIPSLYVRFDANGYATNAIAGEGLMSFEWTDGRLTKLLDMSEVGYVQFDWAGDDFAGIVDDDGNRTEVSWTSYVDRLGMTGYLLGDEIGFILRQIGAPGNKHLPASIGGRSYTYTFDDNGDLVRILVSRSWSSQALEYIIAYTLEAGQDDSSNNSGGEDYNVKPLI